MANLVPVNSSSIQSSDFEIDLKSDAGSLFSLMLEQQSSNGDKVYSTFPRNVKLGSTDSLQWNTPGSEFSELPDQYHAAKVVIVLPRFGFSLYNSEEKKMLCKTTKIAPVNSAEVIDPLPLPVPVYSPQKYDTNPPEPDASLYRFEPWGSKGMSCAECVLSNGHINTYTDKEGKEHVDKCGLNTMVTVFVYQLGKTKVIPSKKMETIEWFNVNELKDAEGNLLYPDGKLFLNLSISRMPVMASKKSTPFKTDATGGYIPDDSQPLAAFLRSLINNRLMYPAKNGMMILNSVVDMYLATPTTTIPMIKRVPVFSVDKENTDPNLVRNAYSLFQEEMNNGSTQPKTETVRSSVVLSATETGEATSVVQDDSDSLDDEDGFSTVG